MSGCRDVSDNRFVYLHEFLTKKETETLPQNRKESER